MEAMEYKKLRFTDVGIFFIFHTIRRFNRDNGLSLSAEAAYYFIMSFIPFMIFLIYIILLFMAKEVRLVVKGLSYLPSEINEVLTPNIDLILSSHISIWLIIGLIIALW